MVARVIDGTLHSPGRIFVGHSSTYRERRRTSYGSREEERAESEEKGKEYEVHGPYKLQDTIEFRWSSVYIEEFTDHMTRRGVESGGVGHDTRRPQRVRRSLSFVKEFRICCGWIYTRMVGSCHISPILIEIFSQSNPFS